MGGVRRCSLGGVRRCSLGGVTPSGRALQQTALTNSLESSSLRSLSRTLFTVSNLKVSRVLDRPL